MPVRYNEPLAAAGSAGSRQKITGLMITNNQEFLVQAASGGTLTVFVCGYNQDSSGAITYFDNSTAVLDGNFNTVLTAISGGVTVFTMWVTNTGDATSFSTQICNAA